MTDHADLIKRLMALDVSGYQFDTVREAAAALEEAGEKEAAADESLVELMTGNDLKDRTIARLTAEVERLEKLTHDPSVAR